MKEVIEQIVGELDFMFQEGVIIKNQAELKQVTQETSRRTLKRPLTSEELVEVIDYCELQKMFYKDPVMSKFSN